MHFSNKIGTVFRLRTERKGNFNSYLQTSKSFSSKIGLKQEYALAPREMGFIAGPMYLN
jgi:hypothetical protein